MNSRKMYVAGIFFLAQFQGFSLPGEKKPNVVFIMSDQHSARALGCYGNREVITPNLDKLAGKGILFGKAFCQTGQSVPSRYSIWTGRYARSTGTYSNGQGQNPDENTVGDLFRNAGYKTATIGKHHMVMNDENQNHGFDVVMNPLGRGKPENPLPFEEVSPGRSEVGDSPLPNEKHTCGLVSSGAISFIRENKDHPFVLWCSFEGPHTPITPSAPWSKQYDPDKLTLPPNHTAIDLQMPGVRGLISKSGKYSKERYHRQTLAYYYGLVSQIDYNIGLVLDELDKLGLTENTIVVYTADHGEMMSEHGAWTKGLTGYDATIRVPLIISFGKQFSGGLTRNELVCSIDLLPTLLDLSGLPIPENVDGKSLSGLVTGDRKWREYAFSEIGSSTLTSVITVRGKSEKYVLFRRNGVTEYEQLFDLVADPWETVNLASDPGHDARLAGLRSVLGNWEKTTGKAEPVISAGKVEE